MTSKCYFKVGNSRLIFLSYMKGVVGGGGGRMGLYNKNRLWRTGAQHVFLRVGWEGGDHGKADKIENNKLCL